MNNRPRRKPFRTIEPFKVLTLLFSFLCPSVLHPQTKALYEGDSIYNHITIEQNGEERCMLFGRYSDSRQTCLNMLKPHTSVFEYTAMMFVGFLFHPDTTNMALIGLGGGYVPTVFKAHLPKVNLDVVEIDPLVYRLAQKYFDFTPGSRQTVIVADGRQYLKITDRTYDQIWIDAFNSDYIPIHMTTKEFLLDAQSRLTKNGIIVQNVHTSNKLYDAQVTTFRTVFSQVFVFEGKQSGNAILVGSNNPLYTPGTFNGLPSSKFVIGTINLREEASKYQPSPEISNKIILTDDFNPAHSLLHQNRGN